MGSDGEQYLLIIFLDEERTLDARLSLPVEGEGGVIVAGTLTGTRGGEQEGDFTSFVLERWGSMELTLLLPFLYYLIFELSLNRAYERCWKQARGQCGRGNIKTVSFNHGLVANLVGRSGCQVECFEPRYELHRE